MRVSNDHTLIVASVEPENKMYCSGKASMLPPNSLASSAAPKSRPPVAPEDDAEAAADAAAVASVSSHAAHRSKSHAAHRQLDGVVTVRLHTSQCRAPVTSIKCSECAWCCA